MNATKETTQQRSEGQGTERDFLEGFIRQRMTVEERVTAYVLLDLALRDAALAETVKGILWEHVGFCFTDLDWHEQKRIDSPEAVRDAQSMLNFWRQQAEPEQRQPEHEAKAPDLDDRTRQRLIDFFKGLDRKSKLAARLYHELHFLDGINFDQGRSDGDKLMDHLDDALEVGTADGMNGEESWLAGVLESCQMITNAT